jgi:hypothetical protein
MRVRFPGEKSRTLPVPLVGRVAMTEDSIIIRMDIAHRGEMRKFDVGNDKRTVLKRILVAAREHLALTTAERNCNSISTFLLRQSAVRGSGRMTETEYARKLDELDRLLNDPDAPMEPSRIWSLLAEIPSETSIADDISPDIFH